jgi:hypothetical protein
MDIRMIPKKYFYGDVFLPKVSACGAVIAMSSLVLTIRRIMLESKGSPESFRNKAPIYIRRKIHGFVK